MPERRRALDLSTGVAAAYAARLLAEVGWDVVKLETPDGDPLRGRESRYGGGEGGAFAFANCGKRGAVVRGREKLESLARTADVVVGDFTPTGCATSPVEPNDYEHLAARAVVLSVTPFGLTGPRAGWAASDLVVQAASGLMFLTGECDQPPMQLPPYAAALTGGIAGGAAALAALRAAGRDGRCRRIDVSTFEAMASLGSVQIGRYVRTGEVARREQRVKQALRMVRASDGFIYCAPGAVARVRMEGIAELLDEPRLAEERFQTAEGRMQNWDEYLELIVPPFAKKSALEWFKQAEALHLTFALVQSVDALFHCPQLGSRRMMRQVPGPDGVPVEIPGRPFRLEDGPPEASLPPPRLGEHTEQVLAEWLA